jgi:hypothetical protein
MNNTSFCLINENNLFVNNSCVSISQNDSDSMLMNCIKSNEISVDSSVLIASIVTLLRSFIICGGLTKFNDDGLKSSELIHEKAVNWVCLVITSGGLIFNLFLLVNDYGGMSMVLVCFKVNIMILMLIISLGVLILFSVMNNTVHVYFGREHGSLMQNLGLLVFQYLLLSILYGSEDVNSHDLQYLSVLGVYMSVIAIVSVGVMITIGLFKFDKCQLITHTALDIMSGWVTSYSLSKRLMIQVDFIDISLMILANLEIVSSIKIMFSGSKWIDLHEKCELNEFNENDEYYS